MCKSDPAGERSRPVTRRTLAHAFGVRDAALLRRWDRIGIGVRCAYNPMGPSALRHYLDAGRRVVSCGVLSELLVHRRMLTVLLQTAHDEALPWYWRSVCLEYTTLPLARLHALMKHHDPMACHALDCAVQSTHDVLAAAHARPGRR
ncbi:hypothetical protein [Aquabacterium sp.]|uniref:hypothetical protein n=1 Tax=Aquabacterium sp. TaxID=1872578 RepID=UPI002CF297F7|nr:hypothetical protein [Aquabacterium sp.]HSW04534.1 hypothetical protein [Aquabacterium sp.]